MIDEAQPSVPGNEVIFYNPDLITTIDFGEANGIKFKAITGSVELIKNTKVFRNDQGRVYKQEKFKPIGVRIYYD